MEVIYSVISTLSILIDYTAYNINYSLFGYLSLFIVHLELFLLARESHILLAYLRTCLIAKSRRQCAPSALTDVVFSLAKTLL